MTHNLSLLDAELCYWWEPAPAAAGAKPGTPAAPADASAPSESYVPADPDAELPVVFRWVVREPQDGSVVEVFVGETAGMTSPAAACGGGAEGSDCCPTHESLREHRRRGRDIRLEVLRFTYFELAGRRVFPTCLVDSRLRRLLTNLFAFQHAQEGHRVLAV